MAYDESRQARLHRCFRFYALLDPPCLPSGTLGVLRRTRFANPGEASTLANLGFVCGC